MVHQALITRFRTCCTDWPTATTWIDVSWFDVSWFDVSWFDMTEHD